VLDGLAVRPYLGAAFGKGGQRRLEPTGKYPALTGDGLLKRLCIQLLCSLSASAFIPVD